MRLDPTSPNSVELPLPSKDQAREIIVAHLDHYQVNPQDKGSVKPFSEEGMDALLKNKEMLHPRVLLSNASKVIQHALQSGAATIDAALVQAAMDNSASVATPDFTEGIEGAL